MKPIPLQSFRRWRPLRTLGLTAVLFAGGAQAAADLQVTMTGTTRAVTDGQASYIIEVKNVAPAPVLIGNNNATDFNLNITLPSTLSDVFWDCNSITTNTASNCGTTSTSTNAGNSFTLTGLDLPQNSGDTLRITVQGRVGAGSPSTITASASVSNTDDTTPGSASLSTTIIGLPSGCANFNEIQRQNSVSGGVWPLDSTITVTPTITGGTASTNQNALPASALLYSASNNLSAPPASLRRSGSASYTLTFSKPVPAREIYFNLFDVNIGRPNIKLTVNGGATAANFVPVLLSGKQATANYRSLAFSSSDGQVYRQVNDAREDGTNATSTPPAVYGDISWMGTGDELVSSITLDMSNAVAGDLVGFDYGAQVGCANPTVRLLGTARTLQDGQGTYVLEAYDADPAGQVFSRFVKDAELNLTLPTSLSDVLWDCNSFGAASCGSQTTGNNAGQTIRLTGLTLPEGGLAAGSVRLVAQGRATVTGIIQTTGSVSSLNDTDTSNNTSALTTAVNAFPPLCPNVTEVQRVNSAASTAAWPMDPTNTVTKTVSGGIASTSPNDATSTNLQYRPDIGLTAPAGSQRTSGDFTYTLSFDRPVPAREVFFSVLDLNVGAPTVTISVAGGASAANFAPVLTNASGPSSGSGGVIRPLAYDSTGVSTGSLMVGRTFRQVTRAQQDIAADPNTVRNSIQFLGQGDELVKSITVNATGVPAGELVAFNYGAQARCAVYSVQKQVSSNVVTAKDEGSGLTLNPGTLTYTITVTNTGTATGTNVTTTDVLESRLKDVNSPDSSATVSGQQVTFTAPSLAVNDSVSYTVTARPEVTADTTQSAIGNVASTTSNDPFVVQATSNTTTTNVLYLKLRKEVRNVTAGTAFGTSATGRNGDTLEYCINATNYSSVAVANATISDSIAATTAPNLNGYGSGLGIRQTVNGVQSFKTSTDADSDGGSLTTTGGKDTANPGLMTNTIGSLAPGETARTCFQATVNKR